jgi:hypothetical protein
MTHKLKIPHHPGCRNLPRSKVSEPAGKSKPSWYLVSTDDRMIPPDAQRTMGSHAVYVSQPQAVASLIEEAAIGSPFSGK